MASSFFPEKSSRSPALYSVGLDIRATSMQLSSAGLYVSPSLSLVISMSGSGTGSTEGSGKVVIVMHSVVKDFLGSAKTRQAILTERPMSFWA